MTKTLTSTENYRNKVTTQKKSHHNFDYTTIADRLRTVSWSKTATQMVWITRFTGTQPSTNRKSCVIKMTHI